MDATRFGGIDRGVPPRGTLRTCDPIDGTETFGVESSMVVDRLTRALSSMSQWQSVLVPLYRGAPPGQDEGKARQREGDDRWLLRVLG